MNELQRVEQAGHLIKQSELDFNKLAQVHNAVHFEREASFALELLKNNSYLTGMALGDPDSLKRAIVNVAAIGLSLNPVHRLAYLLPRGKRVQLAVSYLGFVKLAADEGSIKFCVAEIVREKDSFDIVGFGEAPIHKFKPFDTERGEMVGAYCVAKTHGDDFLTTWMTMDEIAGIRDRSESWKSWIKDGKQTTWKTDESEMIKKTLIRRAYKSWPQADSRPRFDEAINVMNEAEPVELDKLPASAPASLIQSLAIKQRELIDELGKSQEEYIAHCARVCGREIKTLEDMTETEARNAIQMLGLMVDKRHAKGAKDENPQ